MMNNDNNLVAEGSAAANVSDVAAADAERERSEDRQRGLWDKLRVPIMRTVAVFGALVFLVSLLTGSAAIYTSRPQFCRSCHIMEPYYQSWQDSTHSHVTCIKCHFAPGFGEEIRGKMAGLVQLAKYVTSSEGPRPAAEVSDTSCLRSGCHETRLLAGRVEFGGTHFDHAPHLKKMRRGKKLRCTSCHGQGDPSTHMSVTLTTCFLCHFKGEHLNQGLGACTRCHQIPEDKYDLGGGVPFDHNLAYDRGVDCANCHRDVVRGTGEVPRERCGVCHNRKDDLARIDDHVFLHQKHVTDHKIDCLECHLTIRHSVDKQAIVHDASDCASCHPNHHREQVKMLQGTGAKTTGPVANEMISARISCPSCHQEEVVSATGTVLKEATIRACAECHDASAVERLWSTYETLRGALGGIQTGIANARQGLDTAILNPDRMIALEDQLSDLQHDLDFLRAANGIHNIHYAKTLTRALVEKLSSVCRTLKVDLPPIELSGEGEGLE